MEIIIVLIIILLFSRGVHSIKKSFKKCNNCLEKSNCSKDGCKQMDIYSEYNKRK